MLLADTFMRWDCALSAEPAISKMLNRDMAGLRYSWIADISERMRPDNTCRLLW
ncbi:Uncharacterised protein [Bordetella pertussis]|nr:Uncharacterised protein [Bordetella pertussis]CPM20499.1 Uncharacterised protein [Bordetella pertussis]CPM56146.1 Uncharacterised protein [Bordetella pertussis]CPO22598.1 Uncharacterised protein [Bordetella pertussis]